MKPTKLFYGADGRINTDNASRTKNIFPIETLNGPEDAIGGTAAVLQDFIFVNPGIFRFLQPHKSKMFFVKSEKNKGKIYQEPAAALEPMVMATPFLFNHVSVAAQSQVFATNQSVGDLTSIVARRPRFELTRNKSLKFDIKGSTAGEYAFGFASGKSKVMIHADTASGLIDNVVIDSLNAAGQAISFKANENAVNKKVSITLTSFDEKRSYQINNIKVEAGQIFTLQHNDACKELILHNSDRAISFDLKLFLDQNQTPVLVKENITLDALSVVNMQPENWVSMVNQGQDAALKIDSFDRIGGTLVSSRLI